MLTKVKKSNSLDSFKFTFLSILFGLFVGGIILLIAGYNPIEGYIVIFKGIFSKPSYISYTIISATPLILTGLSVVFSFKTGLFNIGAEGQYIIGSLTAALLGGYLRLPIYIHIPISLIGAAIAGGLWGLIAGWLKVKFQVNEIISTIMLNWIAFHLNNFIVTRPSIKVHGKNATEFIQSTARIEFLPEWKLSDAGLLFREEHPILNDIFRTPVNFGIFIAIFVAILIWFLLTKTNTGYSIRLVGDNMSCARYNGVNVAKSVALAMFICGLLAGLSGAVQVLGRTRNVTELASMESYGFNGIAVALIAKNSPIGCIFSGLFFAALTYGGSKIQSVLGAPSEIIDIVIGIIILFIAVPKIFHIIKDFKIKRETVKNTK
ncbi:MAG: ABC transporter permease [Clostridiales bacterium]|nr:ABC transporter permease [Clostridiales bacterium]